jgi:hypothetical protein
MPSLSLNVGLNNGRKLPFGGFDADAAAYFVTAGVTDATAKSQINAFVVGVKGLGLYNNMVCWPLRSTQNAGTGLLAYSLGGLTTANATLSGGSWTSDGFSLSSAQYANATIPSQSQDLSLMLVASGDGTTYSSFPHFLGVQSNATWILNQFVISSNGIASDYTSIVRNSLSDTIGGSITNSLSASTAFTCLASSFKLNNLYTNKNYLTGGSASVSAPTTGTSTLNRMQLNGRWTGSLSLANPMKVSFPAIFAPAIFSTMDQVYTLYKTTLGQGLGLP